MYEHGKILRYHGVQKMSIPRLSGLQPELNLEGIFQVMKTKYKYWNFDLEPLTHQQVIELTTNHLDIYFLKELGVVGYKEDLQSLNVGIPIKLTSSVHKPLCHCCESHYTKLKSSVTPLPAFLPQVEKKTQNQTTVRYIQFNPLVQVPPTPLTPEAASPF